MITKQKVKDIEISIKPVLEDLRDAAIKLETLHDKYPGMRILINRGKEIRQGMKKAFAHIGRETNKIGVHGGLKPMFLKEAIEEARKLSRSVYKLERALER